MYKFVANYLLMNRLLTRIAYIVFFVLVTTSSQGMSATATADTVPPVEFIAEMQPWPSEFGPLTAGFLDPSYGDSVRTQWQSHAASVAQQLTSEHLLGISRWAKTEMATFTVSAAQIASLTFGPEAQTLNREQVLYSQCLSEGVPLPSHHPLVFRRLIIAASFDTATRRICRFYVTIRGRREE